MNKKDTIGSVCQRFAAGDEQTMRAVQSALDRETGVKTIPLLKPDFLLGHKVASRTIGELIDIMADAVKTAVSRTVSAGVYPVNMAADGTMTLVPDEPLVTSRLADLDNFGQTRLGVSISCQSTNPLGFQVSVGPFFELRDSIRRAVKDAQRRLSKKGKHKRRS